jgi:hypothetical protein
MTIWSDMQRSLVRRWIIAAALVAVAAIAGCSAALKFTYNQAPTLAYWWMDGYVDFNDAQAPRARQLIDQWFAWNRREELPDYAVLLDRWQTQVLDPVLTPQTLCAAAQDVRQRVLMAYERAVPGIAEVAVTLTPEQLQQMEKRFAKNNAKFRDEFLSPDADQRAKAQAKKAQERFEMVYGSLDDAQHQRLLQLEAASPYDPVRWIEERKLLQQEIVQTLRALTAAHGSDAAQATAQAQTALRAIGHHFDRSPREAYRAQQQRVWDYNCVVAAQMHNAMTPAQRQHARDKLARWEDDLRALHAAAP